MPLKLRHADGSVADLGTTGVLRFDTAEAVFTFVEVPSEPVPSLLRGFSAPVKMEVSGQSDEHLYFLLAHDSDPFNRWEAGQRLSRKLLLQLYSAAAAGGAAHGDKAVAERCGAAGGVPEALVAAFKALLTDEDLDGSFKAMAISLPTSNELLDAISGGADPTLLYAVRMYVVRQLAAALRPELEAAVKANDDPAGTPYAFTAAACARRALKNRALALLSTLEDPTITAMLLRRFKEASNMTDEISALGSLVELSGPERETALAAFYDKFKDEPLVLLKWLGLQVAARMVSAFTTWRQYDASRQALMRAQLERIVAHPGLSENVFEIASKSLK
ncbi:hypothetical protein CHLRE_04g213250v5 [Chlamydomonas reinhardtii]|uniref:Uncharacterized protein n=1 Tax=Chlamydomonas reinhardtii TaxID=3055 RepID=A0A2K3DTW7_CHLRE|nr:uncharacterized protein CHLRE_04g213250v5 [Chlamydomonas reinhardtii]PNW83978.1 hypothetical protein CHLRE_04g213250v5 [Chlamydomonas reinhardtii]